MTNSTNAVSPSTKSKQIRTAVIAWGMFAGILGGAVLAAMWFSKQAELSSPLAMKILPAQSGAFLYAVALDAKCSSLNEKKSSSEGPKTILGRHIACLDQGLSTVDREKLMKDPEIQQQMKNWINGENPRAKEAVRKSLMEGDLTQSVGGAIVMLGRLNQWAVECAASGDMACMNEAKTKANKFAKIFKDNEVLFLEALIRHDKKYGKGGAEILVQEQALVGKALAILRKMESPQAEWIAIKKFQSGQGEEEIAERGRLAGEWGSAQAKDWTFMAKERASGS